MSYPDEERITVRIWEGEPTVSYPVEVRHTGGLGEANLCMTARQARWLRRDLKKVIRELEAGGHA
jgi:hypothetical protein